jgi:transcriptional regulator with XRE-family HTH domain
MRRIWPGMSRFRFAKCTNRMFGRCLTLVSIMVSPVACLPEVCRQAVTRTIHSAGTLLEHSGCFRARRQTITRRWHCWYAGSGAEGSTRTESSGEDALFGARLRRLREAAGLTQEELAGRAGLTAKAISLFERSDRKRPYQHTVRALADALGLQEAERASLLSAVPRRTADTPVFEGATRPSALLASLAPLVGRDREIGEVAKLLARAEVRLLTLTGPGGIGKTRLGIEAARKAAENFPDGVAFVALAPLRGAALVMPTVSQALGLREAAGVGPLEVLRQYLSRKNYLLMLDNF